MRYLPVRRSDLGLGCLIPKSSCPIDSLAQMVSFRCAESQSAFASAAIVNLCYLFAKFACFKTVMKWCRHEMTSLGAALGNEVIWTSYLVSTTSRDKITHLSSWHSAVCCSSKTPRFVSVQAKPLLDMYGRLLSQAAETGRLPLSRYKSRDIKGGKNLLVSFVLPLVL